MAKSPIDQYNVFLKTQKSKPWAKLERESHIVYIQWQQTFLAVIEQLFQLIMFWKIAAHINSTMASHEEWWRNIINSKQWWTHNITVEGFSNLSSEWNNRFEMRWRLKMWYRSIRFFSFIWSCAAIRLPTKCKKNRVNFDSSRQKIIIITKDLFLLCSCS